VQGSEERVVVEPPGLLLGEQAEGTRSTAVAAHLDVAEAFERSAQRTVFQPPHAAVVHAGGGPQAFELAAQLGLERALAAERGEVLDVVERQVLRVDRHGAQRRIGRGLVLGELVDGQQLQQRQAGRVEPLGGRGEVADLADSPAAGRSQREERDQQPGPP
jgi:hypothetical protein